MPQPEELSEGKKRGSRSCLTAIQKEVNNQSPLDNPPPFITSRFVWPIMGTAVKIEELRNAGQTERRLIMQHELEAYRSLIVTALYTLRGASDVADKGLFVRALEYCVRHHTILSTSIKDSHSERPVYVRPETIDLKNHIRFLQTADLHKDGDSETDLIKELLRRAHDEPVPYQETIPPWRIIILKLTPHADTNERRYCIAYAFAHSQGDGRSGLIFHKSLLQALQSITIEESQNISSDEMIITSPNLPILPPLDKAAKLYISWGYLLRPALGTYLPKFITRFFGFRANAIPDSPDRWRAAPHTTDPKSMRTGIEIIKIDQEIVDGVLRACRANRTKFTGLLHQLIVPALSKEIPKETPASSFVTITPIDLRHLVPGYSPDDMVTCTTADYEIFPRVDTTEVEFGTQNETLWAAARHTTDLLTARKSTLTDQPVGLLAYLSNYRKWVAGHFGAYGACSYELTNILGFDPETVQKKESDVSDQDYFATMEHMIFSQPAHTTGPPLSFNVVSTKGQNLVITLTWALGGLGFDNEVETVRNIANHITEYLKAVSKAY